MVLAIASLYTDTPMMLGAAIITTTIGVNPLATRPFAATGYELANLAAEASQHASAI